MTDVNYFGVFLYWNPLGTDVIYSVRDPELETCYDRINLCFYSVPKYFLFGDFIIYSVPNQEWPVSPQGKGAGGPKGAHRMRKEKAVVLKPRVGEHRTRLHHAAVSSRS